METTSETQIQDPPELKPLDIGGMLDTSIKLTKRIFKQSAVIMLWITLPLTVVTAIVQTDVVTDGDLSTSAPALIAVLVLSVIQGLFVPVAITDVASKAYLNREFTWREGLRLGFRKSPRTFVIFVLATLGLTVAYVLLILPGIWLTAAWSLCIVALVVEDLGPTESLGRSFKLVKDRWWATFGTLFVGYLLFSVSLAIFSGIAGAAASGVGPINSVGYQLITNGVNFIVTLFATPFIVALLVAIYFDLRVRKEAFDLTLRSQGSDPDSPQESSTPSLPSTPSTPTTPSVPTSPGTPPPPPPPPPSA